MVLASSLAHIASRSASVTSSATSSSKKRPEGTSATPAKPNPSNAWWIAGPCGSSTPGLSVTWTWTFRGRPLSDGDGKGWRAYARESPARQGGGWEENRLFRIANQSQLSCCESLALSLDGSC